MARIPVLRRAAGLATAALLACLAPPAALAQAGRAAQALPLRGPSILRSLAMTVDMSPLGRLGGEETPDVQISMDFARAVRKAVAQAGRDDAAALATLRASFPADGATIYRLSCRACHGPQGVGEPPAVASILGPSLALSPAHHEKMMQAAGAHARPELSQELAQQADQTLRERLAHGGKAATLPNLEVMPAFAHLSQPEIAALEAYLMQLAKAPGAPPSPPTAPESALRIGEHVVRGTCRVCHDATGSSAGHTAMMAGLIPALVNIPQQMSLEAVVHKVRHGWSAMAGLGHQLSRMPVYPYLSDEEVAAAYLYLAYLPPTSR
jgi:mono/diheme cytochrome c family protein